MRLLRYAFMAYFVFLTVLLLVPDPWALLGFRHPLISGNGRGIHAVFFTGLAFLASGSRLDIRPWFLAGVLIAYGAATEGLQSFVPHRSVEFLDFFEDAMGTLVGIGVWHAEAWLVRRRLGAPAAEPSPTEPPSAKPV